MHSEFVSPSAPGPQMNVIVNQPEQLSRHCYRDWHDGLFSCDNDVQNCLLTAFCYHCMQCYLYDRYGECCATAAVIPMAGVVLSVKHRIRHRIHGSIIRDCCTFFLFPPCALCRLYRDMEFVENMNGTLDL
ncbi:hypothetical protein P879_07415 [Paragonimus westermani]|uniref:Cornifelin n=1 Tax=Paragonimus westermani TaxID=34504 RepID=A0A8T0D9T0_9TREM|nr:hypothetical protein P879_07415 [Paragonimus westermani]